MNNLLFPILNGIAIIATAVVFGTDVFFAVVDRKAADKSRDAFALAFSLAFFRGACAPGMFRLLCLRYCEGAHCKSELLRFHPEKLEPLLKVKKSKNQVDTKWFYNRNRNNQMLYLCCTQ